MSKCVYYNICPSRSGWCDDSKCGENCISFLQTHKDMVEGLINDIRKRYNIETKDRRKKLTDAQIEEIKEHHRNKTLTLKQLSERYNISTSGICYIVYPQRKEYQKEYKNRVNKRGNNNE